MNRSLPFYQSPLSTHVIVGVVFLILLSMLLMLPGCTFFKESPSTAKMLVQYSVAKYAEQSSAETRPQHLTNIKTIATAVKSISSGEPVSIVQLESIVGTKVSQLQLSPSDLTLANGLISVIGEQLQQKIGAGLLKPEDKVLIAEVMDWIIEAATLSGAA